MSRVRVQIMNQFHRKSHEYKAIKRYWKLIQQDSRKLSDKRFYRPTFRMHLTNKEILNKLLSYSEDLKHHYQLYQLLLFHFQNKEPEKFFGLIEDNLKQVHPIFQTVFKTFLKDKRTKRKSSTPFNYPIQTPNWKRPIISSNLSSAMPLVFETLKTSKNGFLSL
ncbi:transposase [Streptococcus pneumoniae]|nr:transposase [Streptococcus pneumoniae]VJJ88513.1 transposase [Streptococcus pneumoniae]VKU72120.1 transposase [Streptococcus pneumoniae]VMC94375.1 transposase [Streptococcus pneumoniae]VNA77657.1 transposase [Streptococcus pneumoniae]